MEIKGKITHVLNPVTGTSAKGDWKKQQFVLITQDQYPKSIAFDVFNDKIPAPKQGDEVIVSINIDSREYNGKWFTNIGAWKIENSGGGDNAQQPEQNNQVDNSSEPLEIDDLPF